MRADELRVLEALLNAVERLAGVVDSMSAPGGSHDLRRTFRALLVIRHDIGNLTVDAEKGK